MEGRKNRDIYYIILIILLIILILLLMFNNRVGTIQNCDKVPTGNVDVFDINISCDGDPSRRGGIPNCVPCDNQDNPTDDNGGNGNNSHKDDYPTWDDDDPGENELDKIYVDDVDGNYVYHSNLKIFNNPFYEFEPKIAPGVSNSYAFVVHNNSTVNVKYAIDMYKICNFNINLKYRLKKNGEYIIGDENTWVSVDDLTTSYTELRSNNNDSYVLDWKWEYEGGNDAEDTYIGENMTDTYKLNVLFHFEQE